MGNYDLSSNELLEEKEALQEEFWLINTRHQKQELPFRSWAHNDVQRSASRETAQLSLAFRSDHATAIDALCNHSGILLFNFYATALGVLLDRYTTPSARIFLGTMEQPDKQPGESRYFLFQTKGSTGESFKELFAHNKSFLLQALQYSSPADKLQQLTQRNLAALGEMTITLNSQPYFPGEWTPACHWQINTQSTVPGFTITYDAALYRTDLLELWLHNYARLLEDIIEHLYEPIYKLDILSDREKKLQQAFRQTAVPMPPDSTFISLFEEQVEKTPGNIAVNCEGRALTYRQLNEQANRVCHYLHAQMDIQPDDLVAVHLERSEWMLIAILGLFKAGAAYLPVDPQYPADRIDYMLSDSRCKMVLNEAALVEARQGDYPATNRPLQVAPGNLAYVIYTSGSTGKPKGAMIEHLGMLNHLLSKKDSLQLGPQSSAVQNASPCFDISVWQFLAALLAGGRVLIYPTQLVLDPPAFLAQWEIDQPTVLEVVPSYLAVLLDLLESAPALNISQLQYLLVTGEEIKPALVERWRRLFPDKQLVNAYGPTEAADDITLYFIEQGPLPFQIPIGKPVQNMVIYVLDEQGAQVPIGKYGELYVSGAGVGRGYLYNEARTQAAFSEDPFREQPGVRMYRTGDLGRWLPDGNLEFTGRRDDQVKIRGHRIELGEIEKVMETCPGVEQAVAVIHITAQEEKEIIAYITGKEEIDTALLQAHIAKALPSFMMPRHLMQLPAFPLTPNGKVDRHALPPPPEGNGQYNRNITAARNEVEEKLLLLWSEILNTPATSLSVQDDFFESGGHSLSATRLAGRIQRTFGIAFTFRELFNAPVLEQQAILISQAQQHSFLAIPVLPTAASYALSSSQRRLWILSQVEEGNIAYNMTRIYTFEGALDQQALCTAFDRLVARHEILRTIFREEATGNVQQVILPQGTGGFTMACYDLRQEADPDKAVTEAAHAHFSIPFDLRTGPLVRASLYQVYDNRWVISYVMHHIISDGWSMDILLKEVMDYYQAETSGNAAILPALRIQYKDYAAWQQEQLSGRQLEIHRNWWLQQFAGPLPVWELPGAKARPANKTYQGASISNSIGPELAAALKQLSREQGSTLFMGLLTLVNTILYRYASQDDIIIGCPIAGRDHADLEAQIGFYVNTLAIRTSLQEKDSFRTLLQKVRNTTLGAYEHQVYPFDELVDDIHHQWDMSRNPLFDVSMVLEQPATGSEQLSASLPGLSIREYNGVENNTSWFDLLFVFTEAAEEIRFGLVYNTAIYAAATAQHLSDHLIQLLAAMVQQPDTPVAQIDFISPAEKERLLVQCNDTATDYPRDHSIAHLFEWQAAATPAKTAVVYEAVSITYKELQERSNRLAHFLREQYQVGDGDIVALQPRQKDWLIIGMLAILKCKAAYMPVDADCPDDRLHFMLQDSQSKLLLNEEVWERFRAQEDNYPTASSLQDGRATDLAYIMYTSGSTGRPKGVMIEQHSVVRLVKDTKFVTLTGEEVLLSTGAVSFDATTFEYWGMLLNGGRLVLCDKAVLLDEQQLAALIRQESVTTMWFTAGWFHQLVDKYIEVFQGLHTVLAGGDQLSAAHIKKLLAHYPAIELINGYGPTENTTFSLSSRLTASLDQVPIGRPISNSRVYITDAQGRLCAPGIAGEICVAGDGLARGYLNNPELTALKFIEASFLPGERLYRTGDLGRWQADGQITFLGRIDDQVKIRGYRVEPGEIAAVLQEHPAIASAVVIARDNKSGEKELVAYIVATEPLEAVVLPAFLGQLLPAYMLPLHYVQLEEMPLTLNGKVDRKRLPAPEGNNRSGGHYIAPRTPTETTLALIWEELLGVSRVGVEDNFFDLGGHSLKATRLASQIHKEFGAKVSLRDLFKKVTLQDQAAWIDQSVRSAFQSITPVAPAASYPLSSSQRRLWILSRFDDINAAYNMPAANAFTGELDPLALEQAFHTLIERHENLRTIFKEDETGQVKQYIQPAGASGFKFRLTDLRHQPQQERLVEELVQKDFQTAFQLHTGPLMRVVLYRLDENQWVLTYVLHHIISDGWSMTIMLKELLQLYEAYLRGDANPLTPLRIQYKDYAAWQQQQLHGEALQAHRQYWIDQFAGELPVLDLPLDNPRPPRKTYQGETLSRGLSVDLHRELKARSQEEGITLFMTLLTAVNILLHRYTQQEDIIIGSPIAGREHGDLESQIGFYINTLALRTRINGDQSFRQLAAQVKQTTLGAYAHQAYPFDELVEALNLQRDISRHPLFDIWVVLHSKEEKKQAADTPAAEVLISGYQTQYEQSRFDLLFGFFERGEELRMSVNFNTSIFRKETIERLMDHFEQLLSSIIAAPEMPVGRLNYMPLTESEWLAKAGVERVDYPRETSFLQAFDQQVLARPEAIAVYCEERSVTYGQLQQQSQALAVYLQQEKGIGPETPVAIRLDRSERLLVAILGICRAGGAYLPLDPAWPEERASYVLQHSHCQVVVDEQLLQECQLWSTDKNTGIATVNDVDPARLAYIIYTSGSTGQPKGVQITHRAIMDYCYGLLKKTDIPAGARFGLVAGISADLGNTVLFPALLTGGSIRIFTEAEIVHPASLRKAPIDVLKIVPSHWKALQDQEGPILPAHTLIFGGEALTGDIIQLIKEYTPACKVYNHYGPTETTIGKLIRLIDMSVDTPVLSLGAPFGNTRVYVLDEYGQQVARGIKGEICIGGDGLARGYLHQPAMTAERFIPDPFQEGALLYKTGDLGRWLPDGTIAFLGRKDDQVKLRGYRVEPGEIAAALLSQAQVTAAVVLPKENEQGITNLIAWFTAHEKLDVAALRNALAQSLPPYMVPAFFYQVDTFPLLANGKIDKRSLPLPQDEQDKVAALAPRTEVERTLRSIWSEVLGIDDERIGIKDNFFELGGHSLTAIRTVFKIHEQFNIEFDLTNFFSEPSIEGLAAEIENIQWLRDHSGINTSTQTSLR